jgi:hypothetical protein
MNFYQLKSKVESARNSHFFDHDTLKFFGERMSEMQVLKRTVIITDICDEKHECYVLSVKRHKNWNGACRAYTYYHYFDINTFDVVFAH